MKKGFFNGKERVLAMGIYPTVTLNEARDKRDEARKLLASGIDPGVAKQVAKHTSKILAENTFEAIAREWYSKFSTK
jgi:hypothetical protein